MLEIPDLKHAINEAPTKHDDKAYYPIGDLEDVMHSWLIGYFCSKRFSLIRVLALDFFQFGFEMHGYVEVSASKSPVDFDIQKCV